LKNFEFFENEVDEFEIGTKAEDVKQKLKNVNFFGN